MVSSHEWQVASTASWVRLMPQRSVTVNRPAASFFTTDTAGSVEPPCSEASVVPAGHGEVERAGSVHRPLGSRSTPPSTRRCSSSQLVSTTRRISSIEFGKSESQPPVPKPTTPKTSRSRNLRFLNAVEEATKS